MNFPKGREVTIYNFWECLSYFLTIYPDYDIEQLKEMFFDNLKLESYALEHDEHGTQKLFYDLFCNDDKSYIFIGGD